MMSLKQIQTLLKSLLKTLIVVSSIGGASFALANVQKIVGSPAQIDVKSGQKDITIELVYSVTDNQPTNGIGVDVFYDSTQLVFKSISETEDLDDLLQTQGDLADTDNDDSDTATDLFAKIAFSQFSGDPAFPTGGDIAFDDDWEPPPRAVPFGPFLVLGAFQVVLLPDIFEALPIKLGQWVLGLGA